MISGTALSTFTKSNQPPKFYAKGIAEEVGCGESHNILECLQALPAKTIAQHTLKFDECSLRSDLGLLFPGKNYDHMINTLCTFASIYHYSL